MLRKAELKAMDRDPVRLSLLLLLFAGLAAGGQYSLQYKYHYKARVLTGMPEINGKHAAVSEIKADVEVNMVAAQSFVFKMTNVEVAELNGDFDCEGDTEKELPQEYHVPVDGPGTLIGRHEFALDGGTLLFHEDDELWVTNFYRSVIGLFDIQPVREIVFGEAGSYSTNNNSAFAVTEDTVLGRCKSTYTQHKLSGAAEAKFENYMDKIMTEDVQLDHSSAAISQPARKTGGRGRKTTSKTGRKGSRKGSPQTVSAPDIDPAIWKVIRSINLEDCETRVEHQHALTSVECDMSKDQCENFISRSSHGVFYIRGNAEGLRIEKAYVRGATVISPFGYKTERILTITKQKLKLFSVSPMDSNHPTLEFPHVSDSHLEYVMTVPYESLEGTSNAESWMQYASLKKTYENVYLQQSSAEINSAAEHRVIETIKAGYEAAIATAGKGDNKATFYLPYAAELLHDFTEEEISHFLTTAESELPAGAWDLVLNVLTEVGTDSAVKAVLDAIKDGKVTPFRQVAFFGLLNANLKSATSLKFLLDFLKEQDWNEHPFQTSQSVLNFAHLVYSHCVHKHKRSTSNSYEDIAHLVCERDHILENLQAHLIEKLSQSDKFWQQLLAIESLIQLRTEEALNAVLPYALGEVECDTMVRSVALDFLAPWHFPESTCSCKASLILLDVFENPAEHKLLRARALGYLTSMNPSATVWTRLAFSTRHPLLKDLAAFTYSLIKQASEVRDPIFYKQKLYASHALALSRPSTPAERYSSAKIWSRYLNHNWVGAMDYVLKMKDPLSPLPSELVYYLRRNLGGLTYYRKIDGMLGSNVGDLEDIAIRLFLDKHPPVSYRSKEGRWTTFLNMLKSGLDILEPVRERVEGLLSLIPITGVQFFIPFETEFLLDTMRAFSGDNAPYLEMNNMHSSLYINPVDVILHTTNDIGLPFTASVAAPTVCHFSGNRYFGNTASNRFSMVSQHASHACGMGFKTVAQTSIPWTGSKLGTGVRYSISYRMPFSFHTDFYHPTRNTKITGFVSKIHPEFGNNEEKEVTIATSSNTPFTLLGSAAPVDPQVYLDSQKTIRVAGIARPYRRHDGTLQFMEYDYIGDRYDQTSDRQWKDFNFVNYVMPPTARYWKAELTLRRLDDDSEFIFTINATKTTADRTAQAGAYVSQYGQDHYEDSELCGAVREPIYDQQKTGQDSYDYDFGQQSSSSSSGDYGEFGQQQQPQPEKLTNDPDSETVRPSMGISSSDEPQLAGFMSYLQNRAGWNEAVEGQSLRVSFNTPSNEHAWFELLMATSTCYALPDQKKKKKVMAFTSWVPELSVCAELEGTLPKLNDLDTLHTIRSKDLTKTFEYHLYTGPQCRNGPFYSHYVTRKLTEEGLEVELSEPGHCSAADPVSHFIEHAHYDRLEMKLVHHKNVEHGGVESMYQVWQENLWVERLIEDTLGINCLASFLNQDESTITAARLAPEHRWYWDYSTGCADHHNRQVEFESTWPYLNYIFHSMEAVADVDDHVDHCVIDEHSIRTFDGYFRNMTWDSCPTLASTSCEAGQHDAFAVAVKRSRSGGLAVNMAAQHSQLVISMDSDGVEVNGDAVLTDSYIHELTYQDEYYSQQVSGHIYKRNGFYKIELDGVISVIMKEGKIYLQNLGTPYKGFVCGMCGNNDHEPYNDFVRPNGCFVKSGEEFRKAWVPSSSFDCHSSDGGSAEECLKDEPMPRDSYYHYRF